jgi:hypothetical protein
LLGVTGPAWLRSPFAVALAMIRRLRIVPVLATTLAVLVLLSAALAAAIHTAGPVKGWYQRAFHTPPLLNAPFVVQFDKRQGHSKRERFISIYQARQGSYGLRRTGWSVEGTPIGECVLVENGLLTIITDYTRDSYGNREFNVRHPTSVKLGALADGESWGFALTNNSVYLKSYVNSKLIHCF